MKNICLYFQVHQPFRVRTFRFFDIGKEHHYFDDYLNRSVMHKVATKCYLPANELIYKLIKKHKGKFKVSFSISGTALEQFRMYEPEVLKSFQKLAKTGCVEFLGETYAHSLSALKSKKEFKQQVKLHTSLIEDFFGQKPRIFRNTELIYSDEIGAMVGKMGFKGMLTEGAKHILGWKSPNYLYQSAENPKLKVLLRNFVLSDDIAFRFSNRDWPEWPLTPEKFVTWLDAIPEEEELVNLFMDYETFGEHQWEETGIFEFLKALPGHILKQKKYSFVTPKEAVTQFNPVGPVDVAYPISWADEERDLTAWLGNDLQDDAFEKLYELGKKVHGSKDEKLLKTWRYLQTSDHFYYMCTKFFSDGDVHRYFNPYNTPYDAFINYMNVLADFTMMVDEAYQQTKEMKKKSRTRKQISPKKKKK